MIAMSLICARLSQASGSDAADCCKLPSRLEVPSLSRVGDYLSDRGPPFVLVPAEDDPRKRHHAVACCAAEAAGNSSRISESPRRSPSSHIEADGLLSTRSRHRARFCYRQGSPCLSRGGFRMVATLLPEEHDACFGFTLGGKVTLKLFHDALGRFSGVLDVLLEVHAANIDWVVAGLDHGSVTATVRAVPLDEAASQRVLALCNEYVEAARSIEGGYADFAIPLHRQMYKLAQLADETHHLVIASNGRRISIDAPISLDEFEKPSRYVTFGTLRGRVETLSRRKDLNFRLYELATGVAVTCHMDRESEDTMRNVWGYIADVTGVISRDFDTDNPRSMRGITKVVRVEEGDPHGWRRARGAFRSDTPSEVLIRRLRDDG